MRLISSAISFARQPVRARRRWAFVATLSLQAAVVGFAQSEANAPQSESQRTISFRNDVMAVLSKAGCNAGTCHGNKNGKGGFKLSLRGQDPPADYLALTRDLFARRLDPLEPEGSLILMKPTTQIAHEGGLRFKRGSEEYQILQSWLTAGLPDDSTAAPNLERLEVVPREIVLFEPATEVQLQARATFSNGAIRKVSSLAVYEPASALAKVTHDGLVQMQGTGETTVLVRYLHCQEAVRLTYVPARPGFVWNQPRTSNYIDEHLFAKLQTLRMNPSELCSDEVFLRRAYLDLLGILPTADEARAFLLDESTESGSVPHPSAGHQDVDPDSSLSIQPGPRRGRAGPIPLPGGVRSGTRDSRKLESSSKNASLGGRLQKRARLIEQLFERPEFADFWALKWADLLRAEAHALDQKGVQNFHHWIRRCVAEDRPLDEFVRELITARGSTYGSPAANYYRPNRDALARARSAAQVFLGTRLQCAECHNHPSDRWTQDDYYDWAGLFARVRYKVIENKREIASDEHEWNGEQIVYVAREGTVKNPRTGKEAPPRFLGESTPAGPYGTQATWDGPGARESTPNRSKEGERESARPRGVRAGMAWDDLEGLANWLTSPTNTLFARVQANRIWFHLMGRGLVDPPDDFRATNPSSHPALLDALAQDFVQHKFDVRYLIRLIMNSRAYQLSSEPNETNQSDEVNFSHALVRRLGAEQLLDCQSQATGVPLRFAGYPIGLRAAQLPGVRPESKGKRRANQLDQFLEIFGKPPRLLTTDTERSCECNMSQAFQMISGPTVNELLAEKENRISRLLAAGKSNREMVEELFWTALTRAPTRQELDRLLSELEAARDRRAELEDILWGLLNSKDFLFRR